MNKSMCLIFSLMGGVISTTGIASSAKISYPVPIIIQADGSSGFVLQLAHYITSTKYPGSNQPVKSYKVSFLGDTSVMVVSKKLNYIAGIGSCLKNGPPNIGYIIMKKSSPVLVYRKPNVKHNCSKNGGGPVIGYSYLIPDQPPSSPVKTVDCTPTNNGYVCKYDPNETLQD